jgi:hypothetical protein
MQQQKKLLGEESIEAAVRRVGGLREMVARLGVGGVK